jgi:L-serine kinase (ADP)
VKLVMINPARLRHIEGFSERRVSWLRKKVTTEGRWTKPIALDDEHNLVLDGQHRMEVALALGLKRVPAVKFSYADVEVWSLRPRYSFTWKDVVARAIAGDVYPYKTVKHRFPEELPECDIPLRKLST